MDAGTAAIIGTAVGGVIGFGGTWLSGWKQAKVAARERRANAYTQALIVLNRERLIVQRTWPVIGPGPDPPPALTDEEAGLAQALFGAHASAAMRRLLDSWVHLRVRFWGLAYELGDAWKEREAVAADARLRGISDARGGWRSDDDRYLAGARPGTARHDRRGARPRRAGSHRGSGAEGAW
jgi:hypothetical protein